MALEGLKASMWQTASLFSDCITLELIFTTCWSGLGAAWLFKLPPIAYCSQTYSCHLTRLTLMIWRTLLPSCHWSALGNDASAYIHVKLLLFAVGFLEITVIIWNMQSFQHQIVLTDGCVCALAAFDVRCHQGPCYTENYVTYIICRKLIPPHCC